MASSEDKKYRKTSWKDVPWAGIYFFGIGPVLFAVGYWVWLGVFNLSEDDMGGYVFMLFLGWWFTFLWRANVKEANRARERAKKDARDKARKRRQEKRRKEEEEARVADEKARLEQQKALENAQKPKLPALEAAKLALSLVETMSLEELRPVMEILKNPKEIGEVLQNANDELVDRYREKIEAIYASVGIVPSEPYYDTQLKTDLERCMSLGMNSIEKKLELEGISGNVPSKVSGKKIEKTKKWKEIQEGLK